MSSDGQEQLAKDNRSVPQRRGWLALLPVGLFSLLALVFIIAMEGAEPDKLPSMLIGKPAPQMVLPAVPGLDLPGLEMTKLKGKVVWVNLWGSWCGPCREEHPQLMTLAQQKELVMVGINYKDKANNAIEMLKKLGNPFAVIGFDQAGRGSLDWGISGVPESFLVERDGTVSYKFTGPIMPEALTKEVLPRIKAALAKQPPQ